MIMKLKTTTIIQKVVIPASPEEVYDAFIDPRKHSEFTGSEATCDPKVGGKFTAWDGYISGRNLELEKGKRIVQEWATAEWPKGYPSSTLELTFRRIKGGTQLKMVHSHVPVEQAEDYKQGWVDNYWELLKDYFQKRKRPE
jgi:activator of HSP90 ATPase